MSSSWSFKPWNWRSINGCLHPPNRTMNEYAFPVELLWGLVATIFLFLRCKGHGVGSLLNYASGKSFHIAFAFFLAKFSSYLVLFTMEYLLVRFPLQAAPWGIVSFRLLRMAFESCEGNVFVFWINHGWLYSSLCVDTLSPFHVFLIGLTENSQSFSWDLVRFVTVRMLKLFLLYPTVFGNEFNGYAMNNGINLKVFSILFFLCVTVRSILELMIPFKFHAFTLKYFVEK